jgi:hypothetical protein
MYLPEVHILLFWDALLIQQMKYESFFTACTFLVLSEGNKNKKFCNSRTKETFTICCRNQFTFCACGGYTDFTQIVFVSHHAMLILYVFTLFVLFTPLVRYANITFCSCNMRATLGFINFSHFMTKVTLAHGTPRGVNYSRSTLSNAAAAFHTEKWNSTYEYAFHISRTLLIN